MNGPKGVWACEMCFPKDMGKGKSVYQGLGTVFWTWLLNGWNLLSGGTRGGEILCGCLVGFSRGPNFFHQCWSLSTLVVRIREWMPMAKCLGANVVSLGGPAKCESSGGQDHDRLGSEGALS